MTILYSCKSEIDSHGAKLYRITKFDSDMNVESSYITDGIACECPAGERPTCRHRQMLQSFLLRGFVNTGWMLDFDRGGWVDMRSLETEFEDIAQPVEQSEVESEAVEQNESASETNDLARAPTYNWSEQQVSDDWRTVVRVANVDTTKVSTPRPINRRGF